MDKPISVGDLVMVVKPNRCCGAKGKSFGAIFRVEAFVTEWARCHYCHHKEYESDAIGSYGSVSRYRLKRIPPPEELGIVDEKEELHA